MAFSGMPPWLRQLQIQHLHVRLRMMRQQHDKLLLALTVAEQEEAHRQRRRRTCWVKPWLQRRPLLGQYDTLMRELMREAHGDFKRFLRMSPEMFLELVQMISPRITKKGPPTTARARDKVGYHSTFSGNWL